MTNPILDAVRAQLGPGDPARRHVVYLAIGFPPAAKSCAYRMRETANQLTAQGCDVTVVTISDESWEREYGVDHTLSEAVDPRVRVVKLPLFRPDLEMDIRAYSEDRALRPLQWLAALRRDSVKDFPEPIFGAWRGDLEQAVLEIHRRRPVDLLVSTSVPYVNLAATWRLWEEHEVPYVVDFRDGWSVDVIKGGEAFARDSVSGRWEDKLLRHAVAFWCVNEPIAEWYRARYPDLAGKVRTVRNGYDVDSIPAVNHRADAAAGLTFGYLGVLNLPTVLLTNTLDAWRQARAEDPVLARSTFEVRGHIGAGWAREDNAHMEALRAAAADGVVFGGPVPKAEVAAAYGRWDALVLMVTGGRFMTSGKVYEYMATGLPVVSAHEDEHDATTILSGYPLWTGRTGLDVDRLTAAFRQAARLALTTGPDDRAAARATALSYERTAQMAPAVRAVTEPAALVPAGSN